MEAIKCSNFNKGLGPDCFDGNILNKSEHLNSKMALEIMDALNEGIIPEYLNRKNVPLTEDGDQGASHTRRDQTYCGQVACI